MNSKITAYKIVDASTCDALTEEVRKRIKEGWQPLGGVSAMSSQEPGWATDICFTQAMVKYGRQETTKPGSDE